MFDHYERPLATVVETAAWLGWGRSAAYEAVRAGELPVLRRGRKLYVVTAKLLAQLGLDGVACRDQALSMTAEATPDPQPYGD